jgi:hypothetical protein
MFYNYGSQNLCRRKDLEFISEINVQSQYHKNYGHTPIISTSAAVIEEILAGRTVKS